MAKLFRNLTLYQKIVRAVTNARTAGSADAQPFTWDWQARRDDYDRWQTLYDNSVYNAQANGGAREAILSEVIGRNDTSLPLHGFINPFGAIVDTYQMCLNGRFGAELRVADRVADDPSQPPVNPLLADPIRRVWRWSNLDNQKSLLQHWAANLGTVGLRVDASLTPDAARVRVRPVSPRDLVDFDESPDGDVTAVKLRYTVLEGPLGEQREEVEYEEEMTRDRLVVRRAGSDQASVVNELGVCPFVLLRHRDVGVEYGVPAFYGTEEVVHHINWLLTRMGLSVDDHIFAQWFAAASGPSPNSFQFGRHKMAYVRTSPGDTAPKMEAMVPKIDFGGTRQVLLDLVAHVRHRQPELTLAYLEALSGQSGETIAKLLIPCEQRVLEARARYEHALTRAIQIALSWGVIGKLWDLGTGTGSRAAADRAYQDGKEDFAFARRPALPETAFDRIKQADASNQDARLKAQTAKDVLAVAGRAEAMKRLGMTDEQIKAAREDIRTSDVVTNAGL